MVDREAVDNFFSVKAPEEYRCAIAFFSFSHSQLYIQVVHSVRSELFYLAFVGVKYLSAPIRWTGANFRTLSSEENLTFMRGLETFDDFSDEELLDDLEGYKVYTTDNLRAKVNIIAAGDADILEKFPYSLEGT